MRLWWCEPFGKTGPGSLINYGSDDLVEHNYTLLWDQEPIHLNIHMPTFEQVITNNQELHFICYKRNRLNQLAIDAGYNKPLNANRRVGSIITSERDSDTVDAVCGWALWL